MIPIKFSVGDRQDALALSTTVLRKLAVTPYSSLNDTE